MRQLLVIIMVWFPVTLWAAGGGEYVKSVNIDHGNLASLQRGAQLFHNYCFSCHSAQYMRYKHVAADLQLPEDLVQQSLMFSDGELGDLMTTNMPASAAANWFGKAPPDLTLTVRQRGEGWVYSYLKSFYLDPSSPTGANNLVLANASMPNVLWSLQGWQRAKFKTVEDEHGHGHQEFVGFETVEPGLMSPDEFDRAVRDIVNYMGYLAEPMRLERQRIGVWVLLFLVVLGGLAYLLKREYWKDVH